MEEWVIIDEFRDYQVSNRGRVRNINTDKMIALARNQAGIIYVGLSVGKTQFKRSVSLLVAQNHLPRINDAFDTPIQLDGDRSNTDVENLMWRPRWFAHRYHRQFKSPPPYRMSVPIIDVKSKEVTYGSKNTFIRYGLLEKDLILAIANRTYVWPTYQIFQALEE